MYPYQMRLFKLIIIYTILIIYSLEVLLFFSAPQEQKSMVKIKDEKIKIAKQKNLKYDLRSPEQFYLDQKKIDKNIAPVFLYAKHFSSFKIYKKAKSENSIIPFRGPINKNSISCAEDLKYRLISNDKYGFKNPNNIYEKKINSILIGDSYAEGLCVEAHNDVAGNLNKRNINTINFGVTGTGPLVSLAILREYGNKFKPKNIFYLYFEGNDLDDLNYEKNETNLLDYLNPDFKIGYIDRYDELKVFLEAAKKESEALISNLKDKTEVKTKKNTSYFKIFTEHLKDILELSNLKNILRFSVLKQQTKTYDLNLFYEVVEQMKFESEKWSGNFHFVYVPSWSRYFTKFTNKDSTIKLKNTIINDLKSKKIKSIDLTEFFDNSKNIKDYFPLGYIGHYNATGYKKIAEILSSNIN